MNSFSPFVHQTIQGSEGRIYPSPFGVILAALAECDNDTTSLFEKARHIEQALACFIKDGRTLQFLNDEETLLIFKHPSDKD